MQCVQYCHTYILEHYNGCTCIEEIYKFNIIT